MRGRSPTFDVIISREDGVTVWHRLQNEIIPAIALVRTLAPSEQFEITTEWDGRDSAGKPVTAGTYTARGRLLVEGEPLQAPLATIALEQ
jgi:flagellar hook assembly protein FlgD